MAIKDMRRYGVTLVTLLLLLVTGVLPLRGAVGSKVEEFDVRSFTTREGLCQSDVKALLQDKYGFIWVGTNDGLSRYDGVSFRTFAAGERGLESGQIQSLVEDCWGNVWVGTNNEGLYRYDRATRRFIHYTMMCGETVNSEISSVRHMILGRDDGEIWFYENLERRVVRMRYSQERGVIEDFERYTYGEQGVKECNLLTIYGYGVEIYFGTTNGLYRYDRKGDKIEKLTSELDGVVVANILRRGDVLYLTVGRELRSYDLRKRRLQSENIPIAHPRKIAWDGESTMLIATSRGLYRSYCSGDGGRLSGCDMIAGYESYWPSSLMTDCDGGVWMGFSKAGLRYYCEKTKPFRVVRGMGNDHVSSIEVLRGGGLYAGTDGSGLYCVKGLNKSVAVVSQVELIPPRSVVYSVVYSEFDGRLFVATNRALYAFKSSDMSKVDVVLEDNTARSLLVDSCYLWVGANNRGLMRYDLRSGECVSLDIRDKISSGGIKSLFVDSGGNLWICSGGGISMISRSERVSSTPEVKRMVTGRYVVTGVVVDRKGRLWYGTQSNGVHMVIYDDLEGDGTQQMCSYTTANGLASNTIKAIVEDKRGDIWVSTTRGLSCISQREEGRIDNYDISQGLQDFEFSGRAVAQFWDGRLLFGGVAGLNHFQPSSFKVDSLSSQPIITDVVVDDVSVYSGDCEVVTLAGLNGGDAVTLCGGHDALVIKFSAPNFRSGVMSSFDYQLEGVDDGWISLPKGEREVRYSHLSAGSYRFRLRSKNIDGVMCRAQRTLDIIVEPSCWATWYALMLYLLLFMVVVAVVVRNIYRPRMQVRKRLDVEQEGVAAICKDDLTTSSDKELLRRVTDYIDANMSNPEFVVGDLCVGVGLSQMVLNKKLKTLTNLTANGLIRQRRLQRAAALLTAGHYSVAEVTYDVGFSDLRYFRECFKREFGMLPQEYKEQHANSEVD